MLFLLGVIATLLSVWFGFYLGRLAPDAKPSAPVPERQYEGAVLDFAVYHDEVVEE